MTRVPIDTLVLDQEHLAAAAAELQAQVAAFEVLIKNAAAGDGKTDLVHKFRLWDKIRALEIGAWQSIRGEYE